LAKRVAIVIIAIAVPLFLTGCGLKQPVRRVTNSTTPTPSAAATDSTNGDASDAVNENSYLGIESSTVDATVNANKEAAEKKAKIWKADAQLVHYSVKLPSDFTLNRATETYTYGSPKDAYNWWTIVFSGKTGKSVRALIPKEDYLGTNFTAIETKFWKSNFVDALQLAEVNGGSEYRDNNEGVEVSVNLAVGQPRNYLWWNVAYSSSSANPIEVLVNPATKEVFATTASPSPNAQATKSPTAAKSPTPAATPDDEVLEEEVL
jgi:hypothetical protein